MKMYFLIKNRLFFLLFCFLASASNAAQYGDWIGKENIDGKYRFIEQYAETTDTGDVVQRIDFTFYANKKWKFTVTTRYIADEIIVYVDGKVFKFEGGGPFHKIAFNVDNDFIKAVWNSKQPVLLEERYKNSNSTYYTVISTKGSAAALLWASSLQN